MKNLKFIVLGLMIVLLALPAQAAFAQQSLCGDTYVVQSGDTIGGIANLCGTSVQSILNLNPGISNPNIIYPGMVLNLQPGNTTQVPIPNTGGVLPSTGAGRSGSPLYVVKPGDNLAYLARRLGVSTSDLQSANPDMQSSNNQLSVGQILVVPGRQNDLPAIAVSPIVGVPGDHVTVAGFGFSDNTKLEIGVGLPGQPYTALKQITTGDNGNFSTTVTVPNQLSLGQTVVFVANNLNSGGIEALSNFFYVVNTSSRTGPVSYLVQPGDTLSYLSRLFGVTIQQIEAANPQIPSSGTIFTGNTIVIPAPGQQGLPGTGGVPQPSNQPSIVILPKSPAPGERVFVLATGFPANTTVDILMGAPGSPAAVSESVNTGSQGVVFSNLVVPQNPNASSPWVIYVATRDRSESVVSQPFSLGIPATGGTNFPGSNPDQQLGNPVWVDNFDTGSNWLISNGTYTNASIQNGHMVLTANTTADGWRITWPVVSNYYLQATETTGQCNPSDRYGLMVQVPVSRSAAQTGYLYGLTCNGQYFLRRWDNNGGVYLVNPTASSAINTGDNATNRIGIAVTDNGQMALYANGQLLTQVSDSTYTGQGRFGLFVGSPNQANFTVNIDQIAYWNLP